MSIVLRLAIGGVCLATPLFAGLYLAHESTRDWLGVYLTAVLFGSAAGAGAIASVAARLFRTHIAAKIFVGCLLATLGCGFCFSGYLDFYIGVLNGHTEPGFALVWLVLPWAIVPSAVLASVLIWIDRHHRLA